jgi:hypothetical protein
MRAVPGTLFWHTPNGGRRDRVEGGRFKALGVLRGIPDILAIRDGKLYALELKSHDGGLSPAQLETLKAIEDAGATVAVVHGLLNAIQKLEEWQLLRGAT